MGPLARDEHEGQRTPVCVTTTVTHVVSAQSCETNGLNSDFKEETKCHFNSYLLVCKKKGKEKAAFHCSLPPRVNTVLLYGN